MQLAAREEDYTLASRLRDQMGPLNAQLHPMRQYLWGRVQTLHGAGSKQERIDAISALGEHSGGAGSTHRLSMYAERHAGTRARRGLRQSGSLLCTPENCCGTEGRPLPSCDGLENFRLAARRATLTSSGVRLYEPFVTAVPTPIRRQWQPLDSQPRQPCPWPCHGAVRAGDAGDKLIVPELAQYLAMPGLQVATEQALWAIFHRSPNPSVSELMNQARLIVGTGPEGRVAADSGHCVQPNTNDFVFMRLSQNILARTCQALQQLYACLVPEQST